MKDFIFLTGEIGVGKTTFTRYFINHLQEKEGTNKTEVLSPTFNIVFEYDVKDFTIKHYDLYRLKNVEDIQNIGLFENTEQCITLIEWPELIKEKPLNRIDLFFKYTDDMNKRFLSIKTTGRLKNYEF